MNMKQALIVTLPLGSNYGGILQAYALQNKLKNMGFTCTTTHSNGGVLNKYMRPLALRVLRPNSYERRSIKKRVQQNTSSFINDYIHVVPLWKAQLLANIGYYDALIAGSDQVWRHKYTKVTHNMFSFAPFMHGRRLSYAASFGKDNVDDYPKRVLNKTKRLATKFDAISVREKSGIEICNNTWGIGAAHHIDPTLLLTVTDYQTLIGKTKSNENDKIFSYILDNNSENQSILKMVSQTLNRSWFTIIDGDNHSGKAMPAVTDWLRCFSEASFIVTDSFHGCVFSILFNKPFIAIGNKDRGLARFTSLLGTFGLLDRLVDSPDGITKKQINAPIDWQSVNEKLSIERKRSLDYLQTHLGRINE